jgi:hypothetical protein
VHLFAKKGVAAQFVTTFVLCFQWIYSRVLSGVVTLYAEIIRTADGRSYT